MKKYAGIGSRKTPDHILEQMQMIGEKLAKKGWLLRSGHADGADKAFEYGCDLAKGQKEIWLPWAMFNGSNSGFSQPSEIAMQMASKIHPKWDLCSQAAKKLHARNCHQVLGWNLDDPVDMLICWTEDGKLVGGTRTAMVIAQQNNIKVVNLAKDPISSDLLA